MAQEIHIHAGAHRTGTSSFQLMLAQNRARLAANGVQALYPKRDGAPGGTVRMRLPGPSAGPRKRYDLAVRLQSELAAHLGAAREMKEIVLSEENLPGRMLHFQSGQFFPAADMRLAMVAEGLRAQGIARPKRLVYVIRSYAELYVSAYRKRAEDNPVVAFDDIAPRMVAMQAGWPDVLAAFQARLDPQEFIVLTYPRRGTSCDLLAHVLGRAIEGLVEPRQVVNLSATDAALEALQERYRAGERMTRAHWKSVLADHAERAEPRGFAVFTRAQKAQLDARYAAHCAAIAEMPGLTFLG